MQRFDYCLVDNIINNIKIIVCKLKTMHAKTKLQSCFSIICYPAQCDNKSKAEKTKERKTKARKNKT